MSLSPFFRVFIDSSGREITDMIDSFTYEDCTEEDDMVLLKMKNKSVSIVDDPELSEGVNIRFIFGYLGGANSGKHIAKIADIDYDYGKTIDITIKATDMGRQMKLTESNNLWKNISSGDIVKKIAAKYKMEANVEGKTKTYSSIPQGNMSDLDFVKYLASQEPGGYISYVKDNVLIYKKRKVAQGSAGTFVYGDPNGGVLKFKVSVKKDKKNSGSGETKAAGINPDTLEEIETKADKVGDKTGKYVYDENSKLIDKNNTGKMLGGVTVNNNTDGKGATDKAKANSELEGITATLETEGNPNYVADSVISIAGVGKKHVGNWYVTKISHNVARGGYTNSWGMKKNATSQDVSNPDGKETAANKIYKYDQNGNPVK